MSFIVLKQYYGNYLVLDTEDLVTEAVSFESLHRANTMGYRIFKLNKLEFGIETFNNKYNIYIKGCDKPIYTGSFHPKVSDNFSLSNYNIRLKSICIKKDCILLEVTATTWVMYGIELLIYSTQIIKIPFLDFWSTSLCAYCSEPIHFVSKHNKDREIGMCNKDYFYKECIDYRNFFKTNLVENKVLGVNFNLEGCTDINSRLNPV